MLTSTAQYSNELITYKDKELNVFSEKFMFPNLMFESGFIGVEYIVTFTVAGWAVLGSPVAVCVAPVCFIGNSDALLASPDALEVIVVSYSLTHLLTQ